MLKKDIEEIFAVWESKNKVIKPIKKDLGLQLINEVASMFSAGDYYCFIFNFHTYNMDYASDGVESILGIPPNKFSAHNFLSLLLEEDLLEMKKKEAASLNFKLNKITREDITKYKTVYILRVKGKDGKPITLLHQTQVLSISDDDKIQQVMSVHTDVTHLNLPIDHKVSFIGYQRPNYYYNEKTDDFELIPDTKNSFTEREKEIIRTLIKGHSTNSMAKKLNLSYHTVNTHRKNILKKTKCKSTSEVIAKCIRDGVI